MSTIQIHVPEMPLLRRDDFDYLRARLGNLEPGTIFALSRDFAQNPKTGESPLEERTITWAGTSEGFTTCWLQIEPRETIERLAPVSIMAFSHLLNIYAMVPIKRSMKKLAPWSSRHLLMLTNFGGILLTQSVFEDHCRSLKRDEAVPGKYGLHPFYRPMLQSGLSSHEKLEAIQQIKAITDTMIQHRPRSSLKKTSAEYNHAIAESEVEILLE